MSMVRAFFVYGTLQQDQLRGGMWPRKPERVSRAVTQASVLDLGPYPAAVEGSDWLLGELWEFAEEDLEITCAVLDRIEGYDALGPNNEYERREIKAWRVLDGDQIALENPVRAWMYFCAKPELWKHARQIPPWLNIGSRKVSCWPDPCSRVPASFEEE